MSCAIMSSSFISILAAGRTSQGTNSIAIGAKAGCTSQPNNSIVLNATGAVFSTQPATANALYAKPVRSVAATVAAPTITPPSGFYYAAYNPTTGEFIYFS